MNYEQYKCGIANVHSLKAYTIIIAMENVLRVRARCMVVYNKYGRRGIVGRGSIREGGKSSKKLLRRLGESSKRDLCRKRRGPR